MSITYNPANTRLATDIKIYRRRIVTPPASDPDTAKEIRKHLNGKSPNEFPPTAPDNNDIVTGRAYRTFASWQSGEPPSNQDWVEVPNRLGGSLDLSMPTHLIPKSTTNPGGLPDPTGPSVPWRPPGATADVTIKINADGAVVHKDPATGLEIHAAHDYMHAIFDHLLYTIRDLLEDINDALEKYADKVSVTDPATAEAAAYSAAVKAFEDYSAKLQPGGTSPYATAFNFVGISPVVTNEGFIVSCRVKLNWKNPYHSSSTIAIP